MQEDENKATPKQSNLGARILVALGFGSVGAKLGLFGMVADANALLGGEKISLGQKFRGLFNGDLKNALNNRIETLVKKDGLSIGRALGKTMKFTIITTAVGAAAGVAIGWIRGGLIDNWKDIFKHPVHSTKVIFGIGQKKPAEAAATETAPTEVPTAPEKTDGKWVKYHDQREAKNTPAASASL